MPAPPQLSSERTAAAGYDAWYDTPRGRWIGEREYALLRAQLALRPGDTLLDVGCGTGWFTRRAAADGARVTGVDLDPAALAFARQRGPRSLVYARGDATRLPFADAAFDAAMTVTALCFVDDWPRALAELVRVSRRRFVLGLLHRPSLLWRDKGRAGGAGAYRGAHWHTRAEVDAALRALPVRGVRYRYAVFLPSGTAFARAVEAVLPGVLPLGAFMVVAGELSPRAS